MIHMEEGEARGCDHKCLLVDSKFRSKLRLFCFLVELEHSPDFTSGGNLLPPPELASLKYEYSSRQQEYFFSYNYERNLTHFLGGVILYHSLLPEKSNAKQNYQLGQSKSKPSKHITVNLFFFLPYSTLPKLGLLFFFVLAAFVFENRWSAYLKYTQPCASQKHMSD